MLWLYLGLLVAGCLPLALAWRATRGVSLRHACGWLFVGWLAWGAALTLGDAERLGFETRRFVALALSGCPIVAVLGARQPYVAAWNFVVLALAAVMLLPLVEMTLLGSQTLDGLRLFFLAATLAIGIVNYLPTRFAPAALATGLFLGLELWSLALPDAYPEMVPLPAVHAGLLASPWLALVCGWRQGGSAAFDRLWLSFRDRYGLVWGQRVREQLNRAAHHAGWTGTLTWQGWRGSTPTEEMLETLTALLKRFL